MLLERTSLQFLRPPPTSPYHHSSLRRASQPIMINKVNSLRAINNKKFTQRRKLRVTSVINGVVMRPPFVIRTFKLTPIIQGVYYGAQVPLVGAINHGNMTAKSEMD